MGGGARRSPLKLDTIPSMPMIPFVEKFRELGSRETRSLTVVGRDDLPDGDYGFMELYCNEPGCDCRRVMVVVVRPETGWNKFWATINYGWESPDFYRKWAKDPSLDPAQLKGPFLDPLAAQSKFSPVLLELFEFLVQSPDYVRRLRDHYQLFRAAVEKGRPTSHDRQPNPELPRNLRRRLRKR